MRGRHLRGRAPGDQVEMGATFANRRGIRALTARVVVFTLYLPSIGAFCQKPDRGGRGERLFTPRLGLPRNVRWVQSLSASAWAAPRPGELRFAPRDKLRAAHH